MWSGQVDEVSPILPVRFEVWEFPKSDNDCGCRLDYSNFAPRIGIAYRMTDHTVIRAGGGLYYSENGTAGIMGNRFGIVTLIVLGRKGLHGFPFRRPHSHFPIH